MKRNREWLVRPLRLSVAAGVLALAGCGGETEEAVYPVKGKVLVDGKPAEGVVVAFFPRGKEVDVRPNATTEKDGTFALTTRQKGDGAPAGEYAVVVQQFVTITETQSKQVLPETYTKPTTTALRATVSAGPGNDLPAFEVKTK